jgi:hypothetical protein
MILNYSKMAADLKQLLAFLDAFCRREVSHLLAFLSPLLLIRLYKSMTIVVLAAG